MGSFWTLLSSALLLATVSGQESPVVPGGVPPPPLPPAAAAPLPVPASSAPVGVGAQPALPPTPAAPVAAPGLVAPAAASVPAPTPPAPAPAESAAAANGAIPAAPPSVPPAGVVSNGVSETRDQLDLTDLSKLEEVLAEKLPLSSPVQGEVTKPDDINRLLSSSRVQEEPQEVAPFRVGKTTNPESEEGRLEKPGDTADAVMSAHSVMEETGIGAGEGETGKAAETGAKEGGETGQDDDLVASRVQEAALDDKLGMELLGIVEQIQDMQKEVADALKDE
ncbi:skin secretory protein xP2 isoform X2 [Eurytemora carolleeae]|uniref:skin secretory protein xP2 isoform X2 n=1 Tax=Eurytemora carolleeae TaxID=1294199 RepID=UPI000C788D20|nr:skin secretory protein xP2 isoform X2 [Eurytemora carolleeae]|eukprot:XP_023323193.1 skin secretory protein xP2-like isoform X2 [Eurytemora affinis]